MVREPITKYKKIEVGPTQYPTWAKKLLVVSIIIAVIFGIIPKLNLDKYKKYINDIIIEILDENSPTTVPRKIPSEPLDNTTNDFWDNPQT